MMFGFVVAAVYGMALGLFLFLGLLVAVAVAEEAVCALFRFVRRHRR